jgi:hypothetical protein
MVSPGGAAEVGRKLLSPLRGYHLVWYLFQGLAPLANDYRPSGAKGTSAFRLPRSLPCLVAAV